MRSITARPGFAIIRIHIGPIFGPRSIGKRDRPVSSRGLEVPEQFLGLTAANVDHPNHGRLEARAQALADLVPRIRVGAVPSANARGLQQPAKLVNLKPGYMLWIKALRVIFIEASPGVPELGGIARPVHRGNEREKKACGAVGTPKEADVLDAANAMRERRIVPGLELRPGGPEPMHDLDLGHVEPWLAPSHAARS